MYPSDDCGKLSRQEFGKHITRALRMHLFAPNARDTNAHVQKNASVPVERI